MSDEVTLEKYKEKVAKHRRVVKELENYAQDPNSVMFNVLAQEREALANTEEILRDMENEAKQRAYARMKYESRRLDR